MTRTDLEGAWTAEQLERIGRAEELQLTSRRLRAYTTLWVVRVDDDLYVRSAGGTDRPWYRHAIASRLGRIRAGGVEADVAFHGSADGPTPSAPAS